MNQELIKDINEFLLEPIPQTHDYKKIAYLAGQALLCVIKSTEPEYKWVNEKVGRILRAIDR